jgi:hypothetical protein
MAQWRGQFTGNTHLSKVKDRERQLHHAIEVLATKVTLADRRASMKTVVRLAEQLHLARLRALKAQIASLDPRDTGRLEAAQQKLDQLRAGGVAEVLREFRVRAEFDG